MHHIGSSMTILKGIVFHKKRRLIKKVHALTQIPDHSVVHVLLEMELAVMFEMLIQQFTAHVFLILIWDDTLYRCF